MILEKRIIMSINIIEGILIPFIGTSLGAGCVFVMKNGIGKGLNSALAGFSGGVMIAASIWSLIIPSIESSLELGSFAFLPSCVGFLVGIFALLCLDKAIPYSA